MLNIVLMKSDIQHNIARDPLTSDIETALSEVPVVAIPGRQTGRQDHPGAAGRRAVARRKPSVRSRAQPHSGRRSRRHRRRCCVAARAWSSSTKCNACRSCSKCCGPSATTRLVRPSSCCLEVRPGSGQGRLRNPCRQGQLRGHGRLFPAGGRLDEPGPSLDARRLSAGLPGSFASRLGTLDGILRTDVSGTGHSGTGFTGIAHGDGALLAHARPLPWPGLECFRGWRVRWTSAPRRSIAIATCWPARS